MRYAAMRTVVAVGVMLFLQAVAAEKKVVVPDTLSGNHLHQLDSIEHAFFLSQCCNTTMSDCLAKKPSCSIAARFHAFLKWLVARDTKSSTIAEELDKRYESLTSAKTASIDTAAFPVAGDRRAPVLIAGYVSATCPLCHVITRELYAAVTTGPLAGKAKFMAKPFGTGFANRSLSAMKDHGKYWEYFIAIANVKNRIDSMTVFRIADSLGITTAALKQRMKDSKIDSALAAVTKEANANGVSLVPTLFIDRVRYRSYKDPLWIIDAAEYRYQARMEKKVP
jgi:protein-disulfide isomerase